MVTATDRAERGRFVLAFVLVALSACGGEQGRGSGTERPNLILILADDQRYDTLGITGSPYVDTPHLDQLAEEGAWFTRAYVTTSLCCPARASLYTGLYPHLTGIRNNDDRAPFLSEHRGVAEQLQSAGYETAFFGKWHVHNPGAKRQPGFDHWMSFEGQGQYFDELYTIGDQRRVIEGFNTNVLFDHAIEWMESRERAFFVVLSLKNLHRPYEFPERHREVALRAGYSPPASLDDAPDTLPEFIQRAKTTQRNSFFDDSGTPEENVLGYHRMVLSVDDNVGRLTDALSKAGLRERTVTFFTSDGGFMWGEHGLYRKRTAYEPSIHIPLFVHWPGTIPAGTRTDALALTVDIAPTLVDLARAPAMPLTHGRSLAPLWSEERAKLDWRQDFLYTDGWGKFVDGPQELALCDARYKYVLFRRERLEEALFDREADPDERENLAARPGQSERLADMRERMRAAIAEIDAPASWMTPTKPGSAQDESGD